MVRTGGQVVKNVVGYDLTHLLVDRKAPLAIITRFLRLSQAAGAATLRATFPTFVGRGRRGARLIHSGVVPAGHRAHRRDSLEAVAR